MTQPYHARDVGRPKTGEPSARRNPDLSRAAEVLLVNVVLRKPRIGLKTARGYVTVIVLRHSDVVAVRV